MENTDGTLKGIISHAAIALMVLVWSAAANADISLPQNKWVQLVVPGNSDLVSVESLFANALEAERIDQDWVVYLLDKQTQQYNRLSLGDSIPQGEAVWVIQLTESEVTVPLPDPLPNAQKITGGPCTDRYGCAVVELANLAETGWAMVGQPFINNPALQNALVVIDSASSNCALGCSLEQARNEGLISDLFSFNTNVGRYDVVDLSTSLDTWRAFWIANTTSGSGRLILPAPPLPMPEKIEVLSHTNSSVTVAWTAVTDSRLQSYNLALDGNYAGYTDIGDTQFTFDGLSPGTAYSFGVRSVEVPAEIYSPLTTVSFTLPSAGECAQAERYRTAIIDGMPHAFVDAEGAPQILNGVNVRSPLYSNNSTRYQQSDFDAIAAKGFDHIRIPLDWYRFEPSEGNIDAERLIGLDKIIERAKTSGLGVILDPIHLNDAGSLGANARGVPAWAWGSVTPDSDGKKVFAELVDHALPYLQVMTRRYCDEPAVIAIDLVNEPRESENGESLPIQNPQLISLYRDWIGALRAIDPNKPFIIEPFYGSAKIEASQLEGLQQFGNIIWSLHDYYAGEGSPTDGYTSGGYPNRNAPRTESYSSSSSYPLRSRDTARADMVEHVLVHKNAAMSAGIPLHIGEYGIPVGWGEESRYRFHCDKNQIYLSLGIPSTAWVWNRDIDGGFGMWRRDTGWEAWSDAIFDCR